MEANVLYYGDNLDILRRYVKDESVDLVYLDPPFNSNQNYNVLFHEQNGNRAASQIHAFEDTWTWNQDGEAVFAEIVTAGGRVADCLQAFRTFLGECDMLAYGGATRPTSLASGNATVRSSPLALSGLSWTALAW